MTMTQDMLDRLVYELQNSTFFIMCVMLVVLCGLGVELVRVNRLLERILRQLEKGR